MDPTASHNLPVNSRVEPAVEARWIQYLLSTRRLMTFVFLSLIFMFSARPIVDPDFWWHLKAGEYMVQTGGIPQVDVFSAVYFGKEWVAHEWLSEILIFGTYKLLGFGGLIVVFSLLTTVTFWIVYKRISRRVRHPMLVGGALLLGALASAPTWGVRPHMFSFLLASVFIAVLEAHARKPTKKIFLLVPLMVLWANLHAGFAIGLVFIGLTTVGVAADESLKRGWNWQKILKLLSPLVAVFAFCVLAVAANPNGVRLYSYPLETLNSPAMMKYIGEWHSPDFHQPIFQPLALLLLLVLSSIALAGRKVRVRDLLFLSVTGWATLRSARNVPFFVLIAVPLLARYAYYSIAGGKWARWINKRETAEVGAARLLKIALNILLLIAVPTAIAVQRVKRTTASQTTVTAKTFPVAAVEHMRSVRLPQPIYNEYGWGGYLIWKLHPDYRVHIDGRADVYGDKFLEQFLKTHAGEGDWKASLDEHNIKTVIVRSDAPLANLLRISAGWQQVFDDSQAAIFVRQ